eukprot:scaffold6008_cov20-Tisochrysis_lutea.AAC.2
MASDVLMLSCCRLFMPGRVWPKGTQLILPTPALHLQLAAHMWMFEPACTCAPAMHEFVTDSTHPSLLAHTAQVLSSQHEQHERHHEQQQQQQQQVPDSVAPQAMGTEHARKAGGLPSIKQEPPEQHIPRGTPPADPSQAAPSPPPDQSQRPTAATPAPASSAPHSKDKGECKSGATSSTQGGGDAAGAALRALLGD